MQRSPIEKQLASLSPLERSEFERRLRFVLNSMALKFKLNKEHRALYEIYQKELKVRDRNGAIFLFSLAASAVISYFLDPIKFGLNNPLLLALGALAIFYYFTKFNVSDSSYLIQYRIYEIEIQKLSNSIEQYGSFTVSASDLFFECDEGDDKFKMIFENRAANARLKLEMEMLSYMNIGASNLQRDKFFE